MRLLLVDDSMLVRSMISNLISQWDNFEVIGECGNGNEAVKKAESLKPDLILMDISMPGMNGIDATKHIMQSHPCPIVVFTSEDVSEVSFQALDAGALEVIAKPDIIKMNDPAFTGGFRNLLIQAVKYGNLKRNMNSLNQRSRSKSIYSTEKKVQKKIKMMLIGASTGGPTTVRKLLSALPADFPVPILLSQHIEPGFDQGYVDWLNEDTELEVTLAAPRQEPQKGKVLVAPATHHLICSENEVLQDDGPRVGNQKPSVDKMFLSALTVYGSSLLAVLLTGMGRDGARGCKAIKDQGGITLVQSEASSMIFGMPKAAIDLDGASHILAVEEMPPLIKRLVAP